MYDTYAYFFICGFACDPSRISEELSLTPTRTWLKGDPWLPAKTRPHNCWQLLSPVGRSEMFMGNHIAAILDIVEGKRKLIHSYKRKDYKVGINCVGYFHNEHPGFHLSAELISRLAQLSLDVDFDLYCLDDEENED